MPLHRKWVLSETPDYEPSGLLPDCLEQILSQRGLMDSDTIDFFLNPRLKNLSDPYLIPEMQSAVERIFQATDTQEKVVIYGDYDVDGTSSITIMSKILEAYGLKARTFVPIRSSEGYGLNETALTRCMEEGEQPDLLICVDCGTISVDSIAKLRGEYLCAAGVAFKVAHALLRARPLDNFDLKSLLDLVAIATICDIVPLIGENRILVKHGLRQLEQTAHPGLKRLIKTSAAKSPLSPQQVGFRIGPRLNAAGRMDMASDTVRILDTTSEKEAESLADKLENYNRQRQSLEQTAVSEALEQLAHFDPERDGAIVVGSDNWHPGVVGIVASRLMQRYHCPTFVISFDKSGQGKGSGRSVEGISLVDAIEKNRHLLLAGGGHHMAAGLSIERDKLREFRQEFSQFVQEQTSGKSLKPTLKLDIEVSLEQLDLEFLEIFEKLQPFGAANRQPLFISRNITEAKPTRLLQGKHHKFKFAHEGSNHEIDGIFFASSDVKIPPTPWDIAYTIERNTYRGRTSLQVILKDIRAAEDLQKA